MPERISGTTPERREPEEDSPTKRYPSRFSHLTIPLTMPQKPDGSRRAIFGSRQTPQSPAAFRRVTLMRPMR